MKGRCDYITETGRCQQPAARKGAGTQLCSYHEKVKQGLLQPAAEVLSDVEIKTIMGGRFHGDGRRLDHYVIDDPVEEL